jgi:[acyl-carrier-protein] S-malonyltransferase
MDENKTAWLCPGQGSQFVGMGRDLCQQFPAADRIMDLACEVSGLPLKDFCWQGPEEELSRSEVLQPALVALELGCIALLRDGRFHPDVVAGHSLGEFAALHAAGVLTAEETLALVVERGRLMAWASQQIPGGMIAVKRLDSDQIEEIAASLRPRRTIVVANLNSPAQVVLSGELEALEEAGRLIAARGGQAVRLNVSGPWHSPLLEEAAARFRAALAEVRFRPPEVPVLLNVTATAVTDPEAIRETMGRQITSPVRWHAIVRTMIDVLGVRLFVEVGPGKVLRGLLRQIWPDEKQYAICGVESSRGLERLVHFSFGGVPKAKDHVDSPHGRVPLAQGQREQAP